MGTLCCSCNLFEIPHSTPGAPDGADDEGVDGIGHVGVSGGVARSRANVVIRNLPEVPVADDAVDLESAVV